MSTKIKKQIKKCEHGKQKRYCKEGCGGSQICVHNIIKYNCKNCGNKYCEHKKNKYNCKECKGSQICEHNIIKNICKVCNPNFYCIHNKDKRYCKECGSSSYCNHNKIKGQCKECKGSQICEHNKRKSCCKECKGSQICEHNKSKYYCKICLGTSICIHDKPKYSCKECKGKGICEHNKEKRYCKECKGSKICEHNKQRKTCIICNPSCACEECKLIYVSNRTIYYPLCQACFCNKYPDNEKSTLYKIKEKYLRDELRRQFPNNDINMIFDKKVEDGCSLRRPDVLIDCLTHSIVIECDEEQHKLYKCEERRTNELYLDLGDIPLIMIRFNPDRYVNENEEKVEGCFKPLINIEDIHKKKFYDINKKEWKRRIDILVEEIKKYLQLDTFPNKMYTEIKLFYDEFK